MKPITDGYLKKIAYTGCLGDIGIISRASGIIGVLPQVAAGDHISTDHAERLWSTFALMLFLISLFIVLLMLAMTKKVMMVIPAVENTPCYSISCIFFCSDGYDHPLSKPIETT
ncbi:hypothetical protein ACR780_20520 [Sphingobacterium faecium]|uniref:hypothetical protein n=1 Tax=Sphingobacterium faecium TaxID=34087 RepID=UPI000D347737|nr:hypothetical protein [Sphingobacterium faecium]PTX07238.1 hypothetical protein C8N37_11283 [Sphingobacterium faecium]